METKIRTGELYGMGKATKDLLDEAIILHAHALVIDKDDVDEDNYTDGSSCHAVDEITEQIKKL